MDQDSPPNQVPDQNQPQSEIVGPEISQNPQNQTQNTVGSVIPQPQTPVPNAQVVLPATPNNQLGPQESPVQRSSGGGLEKMQKVAVAFLILALIFAAAILFLGKLPSFNFSLRSLWPR